ncbi:GrpB family protein [Elizabethkingia anophelis]|uniref:GrpB family protein n=1 Tax=Elizabethkingia anophelis TaxID=1117645 RepID=UPI00301BF8CA
MHLTIEKYNPDWKKQFEELKQELEKLTASVYANIQHIGSTSVEGLSAKPVIDIMIGVNSEQDLDKIPPLLAGRQYIYYEKYNEDMPYRRFFVKLKENPSKWLFPEQINKDDEIPEKLHDHSLRLAHIHVIPTDSEHWLRHIAFRDYLKMYPDVKAEYQKLKEELGKKEWEDGNEYNEAKNDFIQSEEQKAVRWYKEK